MADDATIVIGSNTKGAVAGLSDIQFAAGAAFAAITGAIGLTIAKYKEEEAAQQKLNATLQSTGFVAGLTSKELNSLANEIQNTTTYGNEAVLASESLLLTFDKIGKDTFPRAQKAIVDVAAGLKVDLRSATILVGKALNDPIQGMDALGRVGIRFTDTQKELIKTLYETKGAAEAQAQILTLLEKGYHGQAAAAAEGLGAIEQLKNVFGDFLEVIGKQFEPYVVSATKQLIEFFKAIQQNQEIIKFTATFLGVSAAISGILFGVASIPTLIGAINGLNIAIIGTTTTVRGLVGATGLGLLILTISYLVTHFKEVEIASASFLFSAAAGFQEFVTQTVNLLKGFGNVLKGAFTLDYETLSAGFEQVKNATTTGLQSVYQKIVAEHAVWKEAEKTVIKQKNSEISDEEKLHNQQLLDAKQAENQRILDESEKQSIDLLKEQQTRSSTLVAGESDYASSILDIDSSLGDGQVSDYNSTTDELTAAANARRDSLSSIESGASGGSSLSQGASGSGGALRPLIAKGATSTSGTVAFDDSAAGREARSKLKLGQYNPWTGRYDLKEFLQASFAKAGVQFKTGFSGNAAENLIARFSGKEIVIPENFAQGIKQNRYSLSGPGKRSNLGLEITFNSREASRVLNVRETADKKLGTFRGSN